ncbi:hypothetical protein [Paracoccus albus]|uniref:hypothetical protein n=1 Tax=Paracoccus albus TaxID=3017784 RepID=UPI0022F00FFE|nr:hypothetical protein [Paracoccus albus]WBU59830.1 hypothetical protein PAF20_13890 [Paracoccus albus]
MQELLVFICVPPICATVIYLWYLARNSLEAKVIVVFLWLTALSISVVLGGSYILVMGSASALMALFIFVRLWKF